MTIGTTTRASLLAKVRDNADGEAWSQFETLYRDMLIRFCRSRGLQHADAEDVIQLVFTKLVSGLRNFEYDPAKGRFRDYLFRCVRSAISDWNRRPKPQALGVLDSGNEPADNDAELATTFEREWVDHHYRIAIEQAKESCDPQSVHVFESTLAGKNVREIAAELSMTEAAVYKAQQRMKERLRALISAQVREEDERDG